MPTDHLTERDKNEIGEKLVRLKSRIASIRRRQKRTSVGRQKDKMLGRKQIYEKEYHCLRELLIVSNLHLAIRRAKNIFFQKQYKMSSDNLEDLKGSAFIGLCEAVDRFDPSKGRFAVYAEFWIKSHISRYFKNWVSVICVPSGKQEKAASVLIKIKEAEKNRREVDLESITKQVNIDMMDFQVIMGQKQVSFDQPLGHGDDRSLGETIISDTPTPEIMAESKDTAQKIIGTFESLMEKLTNRERFIISQRVTDTLENIGIELNLTRERVRQIEKRAWEKIKKRAKILLSDNSKMPFLEVFDKNDWEVVRDLMDHAYEEINSF